MLNRNHFIFLLTTALFLFSCRPAERNEEKLLIVTTTGIIADCITNIVGDQAEVMAIMGPGVDPHLYKASQGDMVKLSNADIIIYNGLHLEGKMSRVLSKTGESKLTLAIGDFVEDKDLKRVDDGSELRDPHIWFNPRLWIDALEGVALELSKVEGLENVMDNYRSYREQVLAMQAELIETLDSTIAVERRVLITSHDAFSYFGDAFDFDVRGLQGISTAAEYGVKDVTDLIDYIISKEISTLFVENSVSDKNLRSVAEGAAARGFNVKIGGQLYSDALGERNDDAGTYIGMVSTNVRTIIEGLGT